ncbi:hypothetical protein DPMN_094450 [Dreissena polymorpha]|uniref:Uncharacterized protein n=1 Tax=Dreissena polymorpha TaxID=45954 RepID=A0A9D4L4S4_DREPO|nr:hypothetical protein DPMN_094450 [Dreissena polymorpha]
MVVCAKKTGNRGVLWIFKRSISMQPVRPTIPLPHSYRPAQFQLAKRRPFWMLGMGTIVYQYVKKTVI